MRPDGTQKWVGFAASFWHCECICRTSPAAFSERYRKWCKRHSCSFSASKAENVYTASAGHFTTLPKSTGTKLLITSAAAELTAASKTLATVKAEVIRLASQLPEWEIVLELYGAGEIIGPQLMAELGDVRRFSGRRAVFGFAGIDPVIDKSGKHQPDSKPTSKRGSPHLRKTLFQVVSTYLKKSLPDEPVCANFLTKNGARARLITCT
jgi:transposase